MDQGALEQCISALLGDDNQLREQATPIFENIIQDPSSIDCIIYEIHSPSQEIYRQLILVKLLPFLDKNIEQLSTNQEKLKQLFQVLYDFLNSVALSDFTNEDYIIRTIPAMIFLMKILSIDIFTFPPHISMLILPEYLLEIQFQELIEAYQKVIETIAFLLKEFAISRSFRRSYYVYCIISVLNIYDHKTDDSEIQNQIVYKLKEEIFTPIIKHWNIYIKIWSNLGFAINNCFLPLVNLEISFFLRVKCETTSLLNFLIPYEYAITNGLLNEAQLKDKINYALQSSEMIIEENSCLSIDVFHTIDSLMSWIYFRYEQAAFLEYFLNYINESMQTENINKVCTGFYALSLLISRSPGLLNECIDNFLEILSNLLQSDNEIAVFTAINSMISIIDASPESISILSDHIAFVFSFFGVETPEEIMISCCQLITNVSLNIQYFSGDVSQYYHDVTELASIESFSNIISLVIQSGFYYLKDFSNEMLEFQQSYVTELLNSSDIEVQAHGAYIASTMCEAVPRNAFSFIQEVNAKISEILNSFTEFDQSWCDSINYIILTLSTVLELYRDQIFSVIYPNICLVMDICANESCPIIVLENAVRDFIQMRKVSEIQLTPLLHQRIMNLLATNEINDSIISLVSAFCVQFDQSFVENYISTLIESYSLDNLALFISNHNGDQALELLSSVIQNFQIEFYDKIISLIKSICERTDKNVDELLGNLLVATQDLHTGYLCKFVEIVQIAISYKSCSQQFVEMISESIASVESSIFFEYQIRYFTMIGIFYDLEHMQVGFGRINPIVSSINHETVSKILFVEAAAEYHLVLLKYGIVLDNADLLLKYIRFPHYYQGKILELLLAATNVSNIALNQIAIRLLVQYLCHSQRNEISYPIPEALKTQIINQLKNLIANATTLQIVKEEAGQYIQQLSTLLDIPQEE